MSNIFGTVDLHRRVARGELTPEQAAWILMQRNGRWETWLNGLATGAMFGATVAVLVMRVAS